MKSSIKISRDDARALRDIYDAEKKNFSEKVTFQEWRYNFLSDILNKNLKK